MLDRLLAANERFAQGAPRELPALPGRNLVILTCMDHRVDPVAALGLELGDAMVIRNAGGRVTQGFLDDLELLGRIAAEKDSDLSDLELLLIQHTDCGAAAVTGAAEPRERIRSDLETLANDPRVPADLSVTGLIYDTATGRITLSG